MADDRPVDSARATGMPHRGRRAADVRRPASPGTRAPVSGAAARPSGVLARPGRATAVATVAGAGSVGVAARRAPLAVPPACRVAAVPRCHRCPCGVVRHWHRRRAGGRIGAVPVGPCRWRRARRRRRVGPGTVRSGPAPVSRSAVHPGPGALVVPVAPDLPPGGPEATRAVGGRLRLGAPPTAPPSVGPGRPGVLLGRRAGRHRRDVRRCARVRSRRPTAGVGPARRRRSGRTDRRRSSAGRRTRSRPAAARPAPGGTVWVNREAGRTTTAVMPEPGVAVSDTAIPCRAARRATTWKPSRCETARSRSPGSASRTLVRLGQVVGRHADAPVLDGEQVAALVTPVGARRGSVTAVRAGRTGRRSR